MRASARQRRSRWSSRIRARSLNPTIRIGAQITEAVRCTTPSPTGAALDRAVELLELVRLPGRRERVRQYPHQLSGGMRQRVMIAIALASDPVLLIADEATTALDVTTQAQIMELLLDLQRRLGMALIMISHDLGLAASFADEVLVMYAGRAVERRRDAQALRPRADALHAGAARCDPASGEPAARPAGGSPGSAARPVEQPAGCPFAPRCPDVTDKCRELAPPFAEQEPDHLWACWHPCGSGESGS